MIILLIENRYLTHDDIHYKYQYHMDGKVVYQIEALSQIEEQIEQRMDTCRQCNELRVTRPDLRSQSVERREQRIRGKNHAKIEFVGLANTESRYGNKRQYEVEYHRNCKVQQQTRQKLRAFSPYECERNRKYQCHELGIHADRNGVNKPS